MGKMDRIMEIVKKELSTRHVIRRTVFTLKYLYHVIAFQMHLLKLFQVTKEIPASAGLGKIYKF